MIRKVFMYIRGIYKYYQDGISDVLLIRKKVFQEEQNISRELDEDEYDKDALFVMIYDIESSDTNLSNGLAVATGRLIRDEKNNYKIGRIAVIKEKRGLQYGDMVVRMLVNKAFMNGAEKVYVGAQIYAVGFYEKIGFESCNEEYMDLGKKHLKMVLFQNRFCTKCNEE